MIVVRQTDAGEFESLKDKDAYLEMLKGLEL
jgi:hypothetical protein